MKAASVMDFRELARRRLPHMIFDYIDGGSNSETTLRRNVADFESVLLRQRVLEDVSSLDLRVRTLGQTLAMPVGLSPVGLAGLYRWRGEVQAARAAQAAGVPFCLSTAAICSIEEVANAGVRPWFQALVGRHRDYIKQLIDRARAVGSPVLVLTVDVPAHSPRYRDARSGFGRTGLAGLAAQARDGLRRPGWLWDVWLRGRPHGFGNLMDAMGEGKRTKADGQKWLGTNLDRKSTWAFVDWVRENWSGPLVIKGILHPEDARHAVRAGAQAIIVSNHGGRQLDGVSSTIRALPRIVDAVGSDLDIFLDSGVRSGLDVLKALGLGATACFVGRPWAWALAAGGERGVSQMLKIMRAEIEAGMIMTGCPTLASAGSRLLDMPTPSRDTLREAGACSLAG